MFGVLCGAAVDDINPALPIIRNMPQLPLFRVLKVMQDLYHQQYEGRKGRGPTKASTGLRIGFRALNPKPSKLGGPSRTSARPFSTTPLRVFGVSVRFWSVLGAGVQASTPHGLGPPTNV